MATCNPVPDRFNSDSQQKQARRRPRGGSKGEEIPDQPRGQRVHFRVEGAHTGAKAETSLTSSTELTVKLPFKRVLDVGALTVEVRTGGQVSNSLTIEVRRE